MDFTYIDKNYEKIKEDIEFYSDKAKIKKPKLICVTKSATIEEFLYLLTLSPEAIAENRVQMFLEKYEYLDMKNKPEFHLIGQLQTNKVKYIADKVTLIQSLDREELLKEIDKAGRKISRKIPVLLEINSGKEEAKGGVMPEDAERFAEKIKEYPSVFFEGVMTMAPVCEKSDDTRRYFELTRKIYEKLTPLYDTDTPTLSMGMSHSYPEAILEGANTVRIGRKLFEK